MNWKYIRWVNSGAVVGAGLGVVSAFPAAAAALTSWGLGFVPVLAAVVAPVACLAAVSFGLILMKGPYKGSGAALLGFSILTAASFIPGAPLLLTACRVPVMMAFGAAMGGFLSGAGPKPPQPRP